MVPSASARARRAPEPTAIMRPAPRARATRMASRPYVLSLGEGLHVELKRHGIHVTVLIPGPTLTESMGKMGVDQKARS